MSLPLETPDGTVYEVFAKFKPEEPLHHIGTVIAPDEELARVYARKVYDEWSWEEMILVARSRIVFLQEAE